MFKTLSALLVATALFFSNAHAQDACCDNRMFNCNFNLFCPTLYVKADYIYWSPRLDGLKYGMTGGNEVLNGDVLKKGKVHQINWDWDSGFKAGGGMVFDCSGWDVSATYTRLCTNPTNSCAVTEEDFDLFKCWETLNFDGLALNEASAEWQLRFNAVDFDIANEFFINDCFSMRPHFGLKGAWYDQHYKIHYFAEDFTDYNIDHDHNFWGIGPRAGLDMAAHMGWCTSLFGDVSLSSLWSDYSSSREDCATFPTPSPANCSCNGNTDGGGPFRVLYVDDHCHDVFPVLELCVGARWEMPICGGCYIVRGRICWEHQIWWNQNRLIHISPDHCNSHGDLTLQGVTVGGSVEF